MIPVSQQFKDAVCAASRTTYAKVIFKVVDVTAQADATLTVTGEASISKKDQMVNDNINLSTKYATFEQNYWKLDGSFVLPPKPTESGSEMGWWSSELSQADGTFTNPQVITVQFSTNHSSMGLSIVFDIPTNEYAKEFTITAYDSSNTVIYTISITGNTLSKFVLKQNISNYRKILITITKWANGYRRARVNEITFGVIEEYTGNELISADIVEDIDTLNNQVASNELQFSVDNQDKSFNMLNPTGLYPYLQRKQKITPYIGILKPSSDVEFVQMGVYYLDDWSSDEGTMTASFTGYDILNVLAQSKFAGNTYSNKTLAYIATEVFTAAGITNYSLDPALSNIIVGQGSIGNISFREALQLIGMTGMAAVYSDRYGIIQIKQLSNIAQSEVIDFDNVYTSPKINLDTLVNTVIFDIGNGISYTYTDPAKPLNEQVLAVNISNSLITNSTIAESVGAWIMAEYKKRYLYEINWRMNPAFEPGDIVTAEDEFSANKTMRITKQEFRFAGYLSGTTNGKGSGS